MSTTPTDLYAVIGHPIAHSLSPFIHAEFAAQTEQPMSYGAVDIAPDSLAEDVRALLNNGYRGLNVTMPHKSAVLELCDEVSAGVREAGAANTLIWDGHTLRADTTDGVGLISDLTGHVGATVRDASILIVGAGGSTYSILGELLRAEPGRVLVANRTAKRAHQVVNDFEPRGNLGACGLIDIPADTFDIVINATSASIGGTRPDIPRDCVSDALCYDLMYAAGGTPFTDWCQRHGAAGVHTGIGMLIAQAARSFELWRGVTPDEAAVRALIAERFEILY
ncbi:MAG: shikimate dehydrogenase [Gammaproteobacteria bacterium]